MQGNIPEHPKLLIVSDTAVHTDQSGEYYAYEPVVREIESISHLFGEITWIAYRYPFKKEIRNVKPTKGLNIRHILVDAVGGKGLMQRLRIVTAYLKLLIIVPRQISLADIVHSRGPSHPAIVAALFSIFCFRSKRFWHKYAGDWNRSDAPASYKANKYLMKKAQRTIVSVNGHWPNQPVHIKAFENPCLDEEDRVMGFTALLNKKFNDKFDFVFVGHLVDAKGVATIIEAFTNLKDKDRIGTVHFVGDGPRRAIYEEMALQTGVSCRFHGYLPKKEVNSVLSSSQVLLLPSLSEGFPKVIAEGSNFGCIPAVTNISCISQYITDGENGFLLERPETDCLGETIARILATDGKTLKQIAAKAYELGAGFTYSVFSKRISEEFLSL